MSVRSHCLPPASVPFLLVLASSQAAQSTWVVDDDGGSGVDFTSIAQAVSAAGEGDVLIVRDGLYTEFVVRGKSLSVIAEAGHRPLVGELETGSGSGDPVVQVRDLAAGQEVYIRGLQLAGTHNQSFARTPYVDLLNNMGEVWIEDVAVGSGPGFSSEAFTGLTATDCAGVHVARCDFSPPLFANSPFYGHAVVANDSNLTVWDSTLRGAPGESFPPPRDGGDGLRVTGGTVFAAGCVLAGGDGGSSTSPQVVGGDGGSGVHIEGGALVRLRDCELSAGAAGMGSLGPGAAGEEQEVLDGSLVPIAGFRRSLSLSSPVRALQDPITVCFGGQPDDLVFLLWSYVGQMPGFYLNIEHGSLVIDLGGLDGAAFGSVGTGGTLVNVVPPIPLTGSVFQLPCQAAFLEAGGGGFHVSGPSLLTILGNAP